MARWVRRGVAELAAVAVLAVALGGCAAVRFVVNPVGAVVHGTSPTGNPDGPYLGWLAPGQRFTVRSSDGVWCRGHAGGAVDAGGNILCTDLRALPDVLGHASGFVRPLPGHGATFHTEYVTCGSARLYRNYDPDLRRFLTPTDVVFRYGQAIAVRDDHPIHYRLYGALAVRVHMANRWGFVRKTCLALRPPHG